MLQNYSIQNIFYSDKSISTCLSNLGCFDKTHLIVEFEFSDCIVFFSPTINCQNHLKIIPSKIPGDFF